MSGKSAHKSPRAQTIIPKSSESSPSSDPQPPRRPMGTRAGAFRVSPESMGVVLIGLLVTACSPRPADDPAETSPSAQWFTDITAASGIRFEHEAAPDD